MGGKLIFFSVILLLVVITSSSLLIIQEYFPEDSQYKTIHLRDYTMNTYTSEYIAKHRPTSSSYDSRYTETLHEYLEDVNEAKDRQRVDKKKKEKEWFLE